MLSCGVENRPVNEFLSTLRGRLIDYFPNPGNAGDSLIASATYQKFDELGIAFNYYKAGVQQSDTLVIGGGGNLIPLYDNCKKVLMSEAHRYEKVVILPHTIRESDEFLSTFDRRYVVFCRELASFEHIRGKVRGAEVHLAHDMAIAVRPEKLFANTDLTLRARAEFLGRLATRQVGIADVYNERFWCLRGDRERTADVTVPEHNIDISKLFSTAASREKADLATWMLLEFCRSTAHITTNRLHVSIACAVQGARVDLIDNSYGKNSAIWEHSLRGRFLSVNYIGDVLVP
jgi:exopolysaccharide biosynthesis predicted pyruvyltransferase EpsI